MRLRSPGDIDGAIDSLNQMSNQLYTTRSGTVVDRREGWFRWWDIADRQLRSRFADGDLAASLYRTRAEIAATGLDSRPLDVIDHETDIWISRFEQLIAELKGLKVFTARPGQIIVPDTSAFIEGVYFDQFGWDSLDGAIPGELARLVIPILLIDELDDKKRDRNLRVSRRARSVLRRQWELRGASPAEPAPIPGQAATIEIFLDDPWNIPLPKNDSEIVQQALTIRDITDHDVLLAAGDYGMMDGASAVGLKAALVPRPENTRKHHLARTEASGGFRSWCA
jgi:hypothetical protein